MTEKQVLEDYVASGVTHLRQQHGYPTAFRMVSGAFHAVNTILYGVGGATLILARDGAIDAARQNGMGIQASSTVGIGVVVLGAVAVGFALVNAWAALSLFTARQKAYWYLVLINAVSFVWLAFLSTPNNLVQWIQMGISLLIALLLILDPRVKAFYHKGPLAMEWWDEERRHAGKARG